MKPVSQHNCEPHFVRCLVPNTHKKPGEVESPLIIIANTINIIIIITIAIINNAIRWSPRSSCTS